MRLLAFATKPHTSQLNVSCEKKSGTALRHENLTANCKIVSVRKTWHILDDPCHENLTETCQGLLREKNVALTVTSALGKRRSYLLAPCHNTSQKLMRQQPGTSSHQLGLDREVIGIDPRIDRQGSENREPLLSRQVTVYSWFQESIYLGHPKKQIVLSFFLESRGRLFFLNF